MLRDKQWRIKLKYLHADLHTHELCIVELLDGSQGHLFSLHVHKSITIQDVTFCHDAILLKQTS